MLNQFFFSTLLFFFFFLDTTTNYFVWGAKCGAWIWIGRPKYLSFHTLGSPQYEQVFVPTFSFFTDHIHFSVTHLVLLSTIIHSNHNQLNLFERQIIEFIIFCFNPIYIYLFLSQLVWNQPTYIPTYSIHNSYISIYIKRKPFKFRGWIGPAQVGLWKIFVNKRNKSM